MPTTLETDVSISGVEEVLSKTDALIEKFQTAEKFLNEFGEDRPFLQAYIGNVVAADQKTQELINRISKGVRFNADTSELDSMSKKALALQNPIRQLAAELAKVKAAMLVTTDKDILNKLGVESTLLQAELQKIENHVDSLLKKRSLTDVAGASGASGASTGGSQGILGLDSNRPLSGFGQAFRATGLFSLGIDETEVNLALTGFDKLTAKFNGYAEVASRAGDISNKVTQAQKELAVAQEAVAIAEQFQTAATADLTAATVGEAASTEAAIAAKQQFNAVAAEAIAAKGVEAAATEALAAAEAEAAAAASAAWLALLAPIAAVAAAIAVVALVAVHFWDEYVSGAKKATEETNKLADAFYKVFQEQKNQRFADAAERSQKDTQGALEGIIKSGDYSTQLDNLKSRRDTVQGLYNASDPTKDGKKFLAELEQIDKQINDLNTKHLENESKSFESYTESVAKVQEQALAYQQKLRDEQIKTATSVDKVVTDLFLKADKNPLAKLMYDFANATTEAEAKFGRFSGQYKQQAAEIAEITRSQITEKINDELYKIDDRVLKINQEIRRLEGQDSRLPTKDDLTRSYNRDVAEFQRTSNSTNPDAFADFQRRRREIENFDAVKKQQELEQTRRDIEEQVALATRDAGTDAERHDRIVAATGQLKPEELTDNLRKIRIDALRGQAQDTIQQKKDAVETNKKLATFLDNYTKALDEKGLKVNFGESALMNLTVEGKNLSVEEQKKNMKESAPSQNDTKKVYHFDGFGMAGGSNQ